MSEQEQESEPTPDGEPAAFDEDPPVDPEKAQVGNSKAQFFMPDDTEAADQDEEEGAGGESGPSRG
jgi:hypothetical protein